VRTLDSLSSWNERVLRKSGAPSRTELYRYRHDLGLHYASLQRWQDCGCPTSAIYHLELAIRLDDVTGSPSGDPAFDPEIYFELVKGYLHLGLDDKAGEIFDDLFDGLEDHDLDQVAQILSDTTPVRPDGTGPESLHSDEPIFEPVLRDFTTPPPRPPLP
jgi:hypothetical protein